MRNRELVERFADGYQSGHGSNLYIDGDRLIEYSTCLAERDGLGVILNATKYSRTTSKIQNYIRQACDITAEINGLDYGIRTLSDKIQRDEITELYV